jgi:hypothetical protein
VLTEAFRTTSHPDKRKARILPRYRAHLLPASCELATNLEIVISLGRFKAICALSGRWPFIVPSFGKIHDFFGDLRSIADLPQVEQRPLNCFRRVMSQSNSESVREEERRASRRGISKYSPGIAPASWIRSPARWCPQVSKTRLAMSQRQNH